MISVGKNSEEVTFDSNGTKLAGTLLFPSGPGLHPVVIFIHGSGPEDRSNWKDRAKEFVKLGFAALIYDKRGTGKSQGDPIFPNRYSFEVLADDAAAAVMYVAGRSDINKSKIGLVASSQGGWVAPLAASRSPVSFMIIASGSVCTLVEDNVFERNARLELEGFSSKDIEEVTAMHRTDLELTRSGTGYESFQNMWNQYKTSRWFKRVYLDENPAGPDHPYRIWYKTVIDFDPVPYLQKLDIPILWLYGDAVIDRFCPVKLSMDRLAVMKNSRHTVLSFPGADHSLVAGKTDYLLTESVQSWLVGVK